MLYQSIFLSVQKAIFCFYCIPTWTKRYIQLNLCARWLSSPYVLLNCSVLCAHPMLKCRGILHRPAIWQRNNHLCRTPMYVRWAEPSLLLIETKKLDLLRDVWRLSYLSLLPSNMLERRQTSLEHVLRIDNFTKSFLKFRAQNPAAIIQPCLITWRTWIRHMLGSCASSLSPSLSPSQLAGLSGLF